MHFLEFVALLLIGVPLLGISSIVPALIWTHHRRKMEELRIQNKRLIAEDIRNEFASLRSEIRDLRDTTMQYDLSFDTALQQMERRMTQLERNSRYTHQDAPAQHNVTLGGR